VAATVTLHPADTELAEAAAQVLAWLNPAQAHTAPSGAGHGGATPQTALGSALDSDGFPSHVETPHAASQLQEWFWNGQNGEQFGPVTLEDLAQYWNREVNAESYVWRDGMPEWQPLKEVPFLLNAVLKQVQALESMPSSQSSHPQQYQQEYQQEYSGAVQAEMGQDQTHGGLSVQQAMGEQQQHGHEQRQEYGQAQYYGQQGQQGQQGVNHPGQYGPPQSQQSGDSYLSEGYPSQGITLQGAPSGYDSQQHRDQASTAYLAYQTQHSGFPSTANVDDQQHTMASHQWNLGSGGNLMHAMSYETPFSE